MKISKDLKKSFNDKLKRIAKAKKQLKNEFVGLDEIIDEVFDLLEPWFLFSESQVRPTVINLWGMTGVGKTSLVTRIFELLNIKSVYKFDIGDFCGDTSEVKLKHKISDSIFKSGDDDKFVLIFDEFQLGRTIGDAGDEIDRGDLRILWDLFDTGKIEIINSSFNTSKMSILVNKLEECVSNGVTTSGGIVSGNKKFFKNKFDIDKTISEGLIDGDDFFSEEELIFVPDYYHWVIKEIWGDRFIDEKDVISYLKTLNEKETIEFINKTLEKSVVPTVYDFSNSIIFNIGNIDEAYKIANDINPDSDVDFLYDYTSKITITDIKDALMRRFRPEQISRLGNNHIIYRSFTSKQYQEIIKLQISKFIKDVKNRFDLDIIFDETVYDIIYKEGVFPTQGTRPVFSTITALIESYIGKIISDIIKNGTEEIVKIKWLYKDKEYLIQYFNSNDNNFFSKKYPVKLKTENIRTSTKDDIQALIALHEAGHAVCAMMAIEIIPKYVVSKSADADVDGFCMLELPAYKSSKLMKDNIIYTLGGYAAEKLIFGENNLTNGSYGDLESSSNLALSYVKLYGMHGIPMHFGAVHPTKIVYNADQNIIDSDKVACDIVKASLENAISILNEEKTLLLEIAKYLSENNRIDSEKLKEFYDKYSVRKVEFKNKENYYNFKKILGNSE